jgi:hypothetical protein
MNGEGGVGVEKGGEVDEGVGRLRSDWSGGGGVAGVEISKLTI